MKLFRDYSTCIPIIFFPILLFSLAIFGGKALFWGTPALQFIPWHSAAIDILKTGNLPLWNPFNGMGAPLAANYQSALFYPPNWLALLAGWIGGNGLLAWMHTLLIMFHLIWMGLGMVKLVGSLGYGKMNQIISGLAISLSGYFVARAGFFSMIWTASWLPWILYAASRISYPGQREASQSGRQFNSELSVFMGMQLLAGHAQLTWYTLLLLFGWLTFRGWGINRWKGILETWKRALLPGLLAVGLAAVQLLLTAQYLLNSQRSTSVDFTSAMTYSLWPWRLLGFLVPDFFGNPGTGNFWGYASFWEDALYIGVLPFLLALFTLPKLWKKFANSERGSSEQSLIRFLWFFTILSIILALGKNTPLFAFLFRFVPTFDMFNSPVRFLIWAMFSLSLLAGIGFSYWRRPAGKKLYWMRLGTAGGFAVTLGAFAAWIALRDVSATFIRTTALCGLFTSIAGIFTLTLPDPGSKKKMRLWQILVILFIGCDLCMINQSSIPLIDIRFYEKTGLPSAISINKSDRIYLSPYDEYFFKFRRFLTFESFQIDESWDNLNSVLIPNFNIFQGISSVNNFDPLLTQRYRQMMDYVNRLPFGKRQPWYNLMGITMIEKRSRFADLGVSFENIKDSERFRVFYCAEFVENQQIAWQNLVSQMEKEDESFNSDIVIIETRDMQEEACEKSTEYNIKVLQDDPGNMVLKVTSTKPGWLMVADSWYPGWSAKNNSKITEIYRADYLFRAVRIETGENIIEMTYRPAIFWLGLLISAFSIVILVGIFLYRCRNTEKKD